MKTIRWLCAAVLALVLAYLVAAPALTMYAIERAMVENRTMGILWRVDFPALRQSLKIQLNDHLAGQVGPGVQSNAFGAAGLWMGSVVIDAAVESSVNPAGLVAMMQGRKAYTAAWEAFTTPSQDDIAATPRPLAGARYRYESLSRFTVTIRDEDDRPLVFVLTRRGLRWVLSDIRLPLGKPTPLARQVPAMATYPALSA